MEKVWDFLSWSKWTETDQVPDVFRLEAKYDTPVYLL